MQVRLQAKDYKRVHIAVAYKTSERDDRYPKTGRSLYANGAICAPLAELHLSDHALSANETSWVPALRNALLDRAVAVSERTGTLIGGAIGIMIGAMV